MISSRTYTKDEVIRLSHKNAIIVYDGQCMLCNRFIQFILKKDRKPIFKFVAYQSIKDFEKYGNNDSIELIYNGQHTNKSTAILKSYQLLSPIYSWISFFRLIPKTWRDPIYSFIAKYRYSIMGKSEKCIIPDDNIKDRFL